MPLSAANKISIVSVVGLYMGIFVTLCLGMIQIRQQLKQKESAADTESGSDSDEEEAEEHELDSNSDTSEPPEDQSSSIPTSVTSQISQNLAGEPFDYSEDPFRNLGHPRSIASASTLPAHMSHHSSSELIELKPTETKEATKLDESDFNSLEPDFDSDCPNSRPSLVRGRSAPSFLN
ncbi:hypothetical protein IWZ01DRAFT_526172 [Phyllosticta capitalensis]